ncbi:sensor histidine kinase [Sphingomonas elodea]|uniref:sensor histidine kinase n=1 Tax=Sphingomonas elodea TaxID=179878 RepID=UPI0009FE4F35
MPKRLNQHGGRGLRWEFDRSPAEAASNDKLDLVRCGAPDGGCRRTARAADLLAEICHEVRSPLGSLILASIRLAEAVGLPAECRRDADRVRVAGERLVTLLDDLLLQHCVDADGGSPAATHFDLRLLLQELFLLLEIKAEAVSVRLHLAIDPDAPAVVESDRGRVCQIVTNLVDNAIRHAECYNIEIALSAVRDGLYHIRVEDDGCGLQGDRRQLMSGYRVQSGITGAPGGGGLGLRICSAHVERLGGKLSFHDRPGGGLCVTATLPIAIAPYGDAS